MKLQSMYIEGFRGYREKTYIDFEDFTVLLGRNDVGKSSILDALNIFLNDAKIDKGDFNTSSASGQCTIRLDFSDIPKELLAYFSESLKLYFLSESRTLSISKTFQVGAKSKLYLIARLPKKKAPSTATERKKFAKDENLEDHDEKTILNFLKSILSFEDEEGSLEIGAEDKKEIENFLPIYALFRTDRPSTDEDSEVLDPFALAIKEALSTHKVILDDITQKVQDQVFDVAKLTIDKLKTVDSSLAEEMSPEFRKPPKWESLFSFSLQSDNGVPLNKRGSGFRRLVLFSFLQVKAEQDKNTSNSKTLIYAVEEPENSQHPNQQGKIYELLSQISKQEGNQIIATTHSPTLVPCVKLENIRYIRNSSCGAKNVTRIYDNNEGPIHQQVIEDLGFIENQFVTTPKILIYVEGFTDVEFLKNISELMSKKIDGEKLPNLKNNEEVVFIPIGGGGQIKNWLEEEYLKAFGIPIIYISDSDRKDPEKDMERRTCYSYNKNLVEFAHFSTQKREIENYITPEALREALRNIQKPSADNYSDRLNSINKCDMYWDDFSDVEEHVKIIFGNLRSSHVSVPRFREIKSFLCSDVSKKMTIEMLESNNSLEEIKEWLIKIRSMMQS